MSTSANDPAPHISTSTIDDGVHVSEQQKTASQPNITDNHRVKHRLQVDAERMFPKDVGADVTAQISASSDECATSSIGEPAGLKLSSGLDSSPTEQSVNKRLRKPSHRMLLHLEEEHAIADGELLPRKLDKLPMSPPPLGSPPKALITPYKPKPGEKGTCWCCQEEKDKWLMYFGQVYCMSCLYIYKKWIKRNVLPECDSADCNGENFRKCKGCRGKIVNASLPSNRQVKISSQPSLAMPTGQASDQAKLVESDGSLMEQVVMPLSTVSQALTEAQKQALVSYRKSSSNTSLLSATSSVLPMSNHSLTGSPNVSSKFVIGDSPLSRLSSVEGKTSSPLLDLTAVKSVVTPADARESASYTGPRIKHVSRSAIVAQGEPAASSHSYMRLSALPLDEKSKIWKEDRSFAAELSADEQLDDSDPDYKEETPRAKHKLNIKTKFKASSGGGFGKRRKRCGTCSGCIAVNCTVCVYCKDMIKYGGPGKMKQCCIERKCLNQDGPVGPFLANKLLRENSLNSTPSGRPLKKVGRPPKRCTELEVASSGDNDDMDYVADDILVSSQMTNRPLSELLRESKGSKSSTLKISESHLMTGDGLIITDQNSAFSLIESEHRLMADFFDTYDNDKVWKQGVAVVSSDPQCVPVLCFLCGSAGKHKFVYCSVCCEPFHEFCLEESDRPILGKDWICRKCEFCQVCSTLGGPLKCVRCRQVFHSVCLPDGYPAQMSRTGVWVCSTCVRCSSCGAITPGAAGDMWSEDFSLCSKCDLLKKKGNYCPLCGVCYSDDDWDCKMIQCSMCESWTHAKCEHLADDLYELIGLISDDQGQYVCRKCSPPPSGLLENKPGWLLALEKCRAKGFNLILQTLMEKKSATIINHIDPTQLKEFYDKHKELLLQPKDGSFSIAPVEVPVEGVNTNTELRPSNAHTNDLIDSSEVKVSVPDSPILAVMSPEVQASASSTGTDGRRPGSVSEPIRKTRSSQRLDSPLLGSIVTEIVSHRHSQKNVLEQEVVEDGTQRHEKRLKSAAGTEENCATRRSMRQWPSFSPLQPSVKSSPSSNCSSDKSSGTEKCDTRGSVSVQEKSEKYMDVLKVEKLNVENRIAQPPPEDLHTHGSADVEFNKNKIRHSTRRIKGADLKGLERTIPASMDSALRKPVRDMGCVDLDLSIRFPDIQYEKPIITYETLTENGAPLDLQTVKQRINQYKSVGEFVDDIARILQAAIVRSRLSSPNALNSITHLKKQFEDEVKSLFPWHDINTSVQWEHNRCLPKGLLADAVLPPCSEHAYALWREQRSEAIVQPYPSKDNHQLSPADISHMSKTLLARSEGPTSALEPISAMGDDAQGDLGQVGADMPSSDTRRCLLCCLHGDHDENEAGRLIYCGQDDWVHVNCAIWSAEVFEEMDGTLQCVPAAISRGKQLDCDRCLNRGATVGCCAKNCASNYHFMCARQAGCIFQEDKQVFCSNCAVQSTGKVFPADKFAALHTITVDFSNAKISKKAWQRGFEPSDIHIIAGSMTVVNIGKVTPQSDYIDVLVPINYCVTRVYWSTTMPHQRCVYACRVVEVATRQAADVGPSKANVTIVHEPAAPSLGVDMGPALTKVPGEADVEADYLSQMPLCSSGYGMLSNSWPNHSSFPQVSKDPVSRSWPRSSALSALDHSQSTLFPSEALGTGGLFVDEDLGNLMGLASLLNRAAYRSQKSRRFTSHPPAALVSESSVDAACLPANLSEISDPSLSDLAEDELEEKEVIILKDLDDDVANEVIRVIDELTQEEMEKMGGIHAVLEKIVAKYNPEIVNQNYTQPSDIAMSSMCMAAEPSQHMASIMSDTISSLGPSVSQEHSESATSRGDKTDNCASKDLNVRGLDSRLAAGDDSQYMEFGDYDSSHSSSTWQHLQSSSSSDVSGFPVESDEPESLAPPTLTPHTLTSSLTSPVESLAHSISLLSPPTIVITDFSASDAMDVGDPFSDFGAETCSGAAGISDGTKDKLKDLVRRRSESGEGQPSQPKTDPVAPVVSLPDEVFNDPQLAFLQSLFESPQESQQPMESWLYDQCHESSDGTKPIPNNPSLIAVSSMNHCSDMNLSVTHAQPGLGGLTPEQAASDVYGISGTNGSITCEFRSPPIATIGKDIQIIGYESGVSHDICTHQNTAGQLDISVHQCTVVMQGVNVQQGTEFRNSARQESDQTLVAEGHSMRQEPNMNSSTEPGDTTNLLLSSTENVKVPTARRTKYKGVTSCRPVLRSIGWSELLLDSEEEGFYAITRDRTPVASESSMSESSEEETERIIVPPSCSCIVRDSNITSHLPVILGAKVCVEKLPDLNKDSDSEPEQSSPPAPAVAYHTVVEQTPREMSREIRKDMINYCEDTSSSDGESGDAHNLKLRQRKGRINYAEAGPSEEDDDSGTDDDGDGSRQEMSIKRGRGRPKKITTKILLDKDGEICSQSEDIPSDLQKTISDAIRKARLKEGEPNRHSTNQAYAGCGPTGLYSMTETGRRARYAETLAKRADRQELWCDNVPPIKMRHITDSALHVDTDLTGDDCRLTLISPSRHRSMPAAVSDEEIVDGNALISSRCSAKVTKESKVPTTLLAFEISCEDGFSCRADNWNDAWRTVTDARRDNLIAAGLPAPSFAGVSGLRMFGLDHSNIKYFIEQLYGARYCHSYRFCFHKPPLFEYEENLPENPSGCARGEVFSARKPPEMFSFIDSRFRKRPAFHPETANDSELEHLSSRRVTSIDLPMGMRFRHLKTNAKEAVGVYQSGIHGRGLLCKRRIDAGEMVIEYAGEVIRHSLCDKREKFYESKGIGCYMFRIDDYLVVDATMRGNAARFINHSCDPNCFSKVIDVNGAKHIVIFALRTIERGEELTYDYKFPFEEVKIPCACGTKKCRGFLN